MIFLPGLTGNPSPPSDILASARALIISGGHDVFSCADISDGSDSQNRTDHNFPSKVDLVDEWRR